MSKTVTPVMKGVFRKLADRKMAEDAEKAWNQEMERRKESEDK